MMSELARHYGMHTAMACDSGTSALVLALRAALPRGGTVAFPSYACVDLAAAARYTGVRVRLYDLVPSTLSADLDSLGATLRRGVDAVLAAHLYGYPADVPAMRRLSLEHGVPLIEDAAQAAGSRLHRLTVGGLGDLSILSFGRGKGTTGGRGGAVMASDATWAARLDEHAASLRGRAPMGWGDLTRAGAQWLLGRPTLYAIPSAIPGLRLGEMVYHPAHEPRPLSCAAAALVRSALRADPAEVARRRHNAKALESSIDGRSVCSVRPIEGAEPGYLRFAVRVSDLRAPAPVLGITRGYPRALFEQDELRPCLHEDEPEPLGGRHLRTSLFTLPVHGLVTVNDLTRLRAWLDNHSRR